MPELSLKQKIIKKIPGPLGKVIRNYYARKWVEEINAEFETGTEEAMETVLATYSEILVNKFKTRGFSEAGAREIAEWEYYREAGYGPWLGKMAKGDVAL